MRKDWKEYNTQLVKRGQILINPNILNTQSQHQQTKKIGRPFKYPKTLILFILFLKYAFRLPYRQTEGSVKELFKQRGISIYLPNFRTIHPQNFVVVLDSTGIKLTNGGRWLSKKHGNKKRKGWIKLHVALDISIRKITAMKVTDNRAHDSECAVALTETAREKPKL